MDRVRHLFDLGSREAFRELERRFSPSFAVRSHPARVESAVYLDTFDRRLTRAGGALEALRDANGRELVWHDAGEAPLFARTSALPAFQHDLPPGALRAALADRLQRRRLFALAELERTRHTRDVLDEADKTVARLELVERRARDPAGGEGAAWRALPPVLELRPVRGYDAWRERVERFLRGEVGLLPHETGELEDALHALGRPLVFLPPRASIPPDASVTQALRIVLGHRLALLVANEDGVARDLDPEFLHDFRVAIRWTRSLLRPFRAHFSPRIRHFEEEFRWLGRASAPTRDLDVLLQSIDASVAPSSNGSSAALAPIRRALAEARAHAFGTLAGVLHGERQRTLVAGWGRFLDEDLAEPSTRAPILPAASAALWKSFKKLRRRGRELTPGSDRALFHRARVQGKELRYLLESFRELLPSSEVERVARDLKRLQSALGDLNDHELHIELLEAHARELPGAPPETLLAVGRLVGRLEVERERARKRSLARLGKLTARRSQQRFRALSEARHASEPAP